MFSSFKSLKGEGKIQTNNPQTTITFPVIKQPFFFSICTVDSRTIDYFSKEQANLLRTVKKIITGLEVLGESPWKGPFKNRAIQVRFYRFSVYLVAWAMGFEKSLLTHGLWFNFIKLQLICAAHFMLPLHLLSRFLTALCYFLNSDLWCHIKLSLLIHREL